MADSKHTPEYKKSYQRHTIDDVYETYFLRTHDGLHDRWEREAAYKVLDRLNKYNDDYRRAVLDCNAYLSQLIHCKEENQSLRTELIKSDSENQQLRNEVESWEHQARTSEQTNHEHERYIDNLKAEIKELTERVNDLEFQLREQH